MRVCGKEDRHEDLHFGGRVRAGNFLLERGQRVHNEFSARINRRFGEELLIIFNRLGITVLCLKFFAEGEPEADALFGRRI